MCVSTECRLAGVTQRRRCVVWWIVPRLTGVLLQSSKRKSGFRASDELSTDEEEEARDGKVPAAPSLPASSTSTLRKRGPHRLHRVRPDQQPLVPHTVLILFAMLLISDQVVLLGYSRTSGSQSFFTVVSVHVLGLGYGHFYGLIFPPVNTR